MKYCSLSLAGAFFALASTTHGQATGSCPSDLKTYRDVIACAEERSMATQVAMADLERAKAEVLVAGQWKNPEFSATSLQGRINGQLNSQTDVDLGVPIELGGKISSRKKMAQSGVAQSEAKAFEVRAKVRSDVFLNLHRLRQLIHEQEVLDESIATFTKLVTQFSKRPTLSPEQQLSYSVFRMSKSEYEIKRAETFEEMAKLKAYFKVAIGREINELKKLTPESPKNWPEIQNVYSSGLSPRSKIAQTELEASKAALSLAQSDAWPTLMIGPSVQFQNQGGQQTQMYGIHLNVPLPLFNVNQGAKTAAARSLTLSETQESLTRLEEEKEREAFFATYNESKRVLQSSLSHEEIEGRHKEIEALFLKGTVPSALVIEAHRTFVDLEILRNQRELKAISSLLSIYTIDGKILELSL